MVNKCLGKMTDALCEDEYQAKKNDHSNKGYRNIHQICKRNAVQEEDQREDFYSCRQVICVSRSYPALFSQDKFFMDINDRN